MPSKELIINKLIKLVAEHLQKHCKEQEDCDNCKYHYAEHSHCIFCDIPYEWETDKLDGSDN